MRAAELNLSAHFLPPATSFMAEILRLETPHCFGYLPSKKARPARLKAPFTIEEENIINRQIHINHRTLLPVLHRLMEEPRERANAPPGHSPGRPRRIHDSQLSSPILRHGTTNPSIQLYRDMPFLSHNRHAIDYTVGALAGAR